MGTEIELQLACDQYKQAQDKVMLEKAAWEALQRSHQTILDSLLKAGMTRVQAQSEFDGYMKAHADSFGAALEYLELRTREFREVLLQHP